jgi:heterodisulfide reductase subunit C
MATLELENEKLSVSQVFWNSLMELPDGKKFRQCIQCGTCAGVCPYGRWMQTTPRKIIAALRMNEFEDILTSDTAWMCVSCYACASVCPQQLPLTDGLMFRLKEELLLTGNVPAELQLALENSRRYGNPMGESPKKRSAWTEGLDPPIPVHARRESLWTCSGTWAILPPITRKDSRPPKRWSRCSARWV